MKIRQLLTAGLVLLGLFGCSSSNDFPNEPPAGLVDGTMMQLIVEMPKMTGSTSPTVRALTEEKGTDAENRASEVLIAVFRSDNTILATYNQPLILMDGSVNYKTQVFAADDLKVNESYKVYLFVNPYTNMAADDMNKIYINSKGTFEETIAAIASDNKFMMTTATIVDAGKVEESAKNKATPYVVSAKVERVVARMDYKAVNLNNSYLINENTDDVTVTMKKIKLLMTGRSFYHLKRVNPDGQLATASVLGGEETLTNYVVDADWAVKLGSPTDWPNSFFSYLNNPNYKNNLYTDIPVSDSYKKVYYTTENTLPAEKRNIRGIATAMVFKGELQFDLAKYGVTDAKEFVYVWDNTFYGVFGKLPEGVRSQIGDDHSAKNFEKAGVKGYAYEPGFGYPMYYVYYNRHNDNGDDQDVGPMEFGVVRNNVYKLSITTVKLFGHPDDPENPDKQNPDPGKEDPEKPIEEKHIYMNVSCEVLPWTVRSNEIEF